MVCGGVPQLKMLRYAKGYTQQVLADAAGISRDTYQNIESGRSDPRASTLQSIAKVLGVEVQDLFGEAEMPAQVRFRSSRRMNSRSSMSPSMKEITDSSLLTPNRSCTQVQDDR